MADFAIVGIGGAVLVGLIVQVLKQVVPGLDKSRWLVVVALGVGVLLAVLNQVAQIVPGMRTWVDVVFTGLVAGFVAMGMYDTTRTVAGR